MRNYLSFLLALVACSATAQTNLLVGQVGNYGLATQPGIACTLTLISPNPRVVDGIFIRREPQVATSLGNGAFYFTNIIWGKYTLSIAGRVDTVFPINVGTNTLGTVAMGSLSAPNSAVPPNPATNYYTMAQIDATIAGLTNLVVSGGSGSTTMLPWIGPTDGASYHNALTLVDGQPMLILVPGSGTGSSTLAWVGPSNGNSYFLVLRLVDGQPLICLQSL